MKKRVLALLLAGLMVVSLAACSSKENERGNEEDPVVSPIDDPAPVEDPSFTDVNDTVYSVGDTTVLYRELGNNEGKKVVSGKGIEFKRIKISEEKQASKIEYEGETFYVLSNQVTTEDLYGHNYTACNDTMYVNDTDVYYRTAAFVDTTTAVKKLTKGQAVTVVGRGSTWCKIQLDGTEGTYFVKLEYLSTEPPVDYSKVNFDQYFASSSAKEYTVKMNVNIRKYPVLEADTIVGSLKAGDKVTVIGTGSGEYATWGKVRYAEEVAAGETPTNSIGYVKLCSEDCSEVYVTVTNLALSRMISQYGFDRANDETLYATQNLNLRVTPSLTANYAPGALKKGDKIRLIAYGNVTEPDPDDTTKDVTLVWALVEYKDEDENAHFAFASKKYLSESSTTPSSESKQTLRSLLDTYDFLTRVSEEVIYVGNGAVCYTAPEQSAKTTKTLPKDAAVTLAAKGTDNGGTEWYVFYTNEGDYYCAGSTLFYHVDDIIKN